MSRRNVAAAATLAESASMFAALGDETRLRLVSRLCADGPLSISQLSEDAGVTRQAVTKHLRAMGKAGLVRHTRRGREQIWTLEAKRLREARAALDRINHYWDDTLNRLKAFVEDKG
jgi:DNA-binding transcriptional ArsR family regulator